MSEEINVTNNYEEKNQEHKCICQSKGFKKFLIIALGTFVGVYCALCLFAAIHRPPIMAPGMMYGGYPMPGIARPCPCKTMHHHHFKEENINKGAVPSQTGRTAPFQDKADVDD